MGGTEVTASVVVSFIEKLEEDSSRFYIKMAERYPKDKETSLAFARESEKNKVMISRTYHETITDALEACFSFKGINLNDYTFETSLAEEDNYAEALKTALKLEEKASMFYMKLAECSGPLLATIPKAFKKVAEIRSRRMLKVKMLLDNL